MTETERKLASYILAVIEPKLNVWNEKRPCPACGFYSCDSHMACVARELRNMLKEDSNDT